MQTVQKIYCPNCGKTAERYYILDSELTRTQCSSCDYLMISCTRTGKVIEAYAPGIQLSKR
ncbi:replication restart DNA helicase PriA [Fortiea sp. LEGE XX443]|uniref:replication restart DNA helicase PriA n=1 Tax=Fortiea sp. LEGE XX443 TaxID=1828611 RepID=UPI001D1507D2|nr:replication restart DNA helicase PriA [Fortiea sp. LEGE XX443]